MFQDMPISTPDKISVGGLYTPKKKSNFPGQSIFLFSGLTQIKFATKSFPSQMAIRECPHTILTPSRAHIPTSSFSFPVSTTLSSFFIFSYASFISGRHFSRLSNARDHIMVIMVGYEKHQRQRSSIPSQPFIIQTTTKKMESE